MIRDLTLNGHDRLLLIDAKPQSEARSNGEGFFSFDKHPTETDVARKGQRHTFIAVDLSGKPGPIKVAPVARFAMDEMKQRLALLGVDGRELESGPFARKEITNFSAYFENGQVLGRAEA